MLSVVVQKKGNSEKEKFRKIEIQKKRSSEKELQGKKFLEKGGKLEIKKESSNGLQSFRSS